MLLTVRIPHEPFNSYVRDGIVGPTISKILEESKPEAVYFTEQNGTRGAVLVVDVPNASKIPALAEPWFLRFKADCEFRIAMTPEDLVKAELEKLGKMWK
jgi:hypothetical protein